MEAGLGAFGDRSQFKSANGGLDCWRTHGGSDTGERRAQVDMEERRVR
jgi:hypothetical protein